jgi:hypothetical protein
MMVVRRDLNATNGQWIYAWRSGCTYLGNDLVQALIYMRQRFPREQIYLDDRDFSGSPLERWQQRYQITRQPGELKLVEFVNE